MHGPDAHASIAKVTLGMLPNRSDLQASASSTDWLLVCYMLVEIEPNPPKYQNDIKTYLFVLING